MPQIHIVLYEPEIPQNTGNIIRLCANTGAELHLVKPYGFDLDDKKLRRAGLDYAEWENIFQWENMDACFAWLNAHDITPFAMTTKGSASPFTADLNRAVALVFGPETRGLPEAVRLQFPAEHWLKLPMQATSRSLNLSNSVAVGLYEAWRQQSFL